MKMYSVQRGSNHFYICSLDGQYIAKTIGDSAEMKAFAEQITAALNSVYGDRRGRWPISEGMQPPSTDDKPEW